MHDLLLLFNHRCGLTLVFLGRSFLPFRCWLFPYLFALPLRLELCCNY
jgi:hypothetical protein